MFGDAFSIHSRVLRAILRNSNDEVRQTSELSRHQLYSALEERSRIREGEMTDELEEAYRYRRQLVSERNALRDQVAELEHTKNLQHRALLAFARRKEILRRAVSDIHQAWAADRPDDDPRKTEPQIRAWMREIGKQLDADPSEAARLEADVQSVCEAIRKEG